MSGIRNISRCFSTCLRRSEPNAPSTSQRALFEDIHGILTTGLKNDNSTGGVDKKLCDISKYYFDGQGKAIRPRLCLTVADAVNHHYFVNPEKDTQQLKFNQRQIAIISEMYHTASLVHDDVIDKSEERRKKDSVNALWGQKNAVLSGNYVVAIAQKILGQIRDPDVSLKQISNIKLCLNETTSFFRQFFN